MRDDGGINLHHLVYLVDAARFATLSDQFRALGVKAPVESASPMGVSLLYACTRAGTGLFSHFVLLGPGGRQFFASIPTS